MNASAAAAQWQALSDKENQEYYKITQLITSRDAQNHRLLMVKWAYNAVDKYDLDRSIVSFAFSYFDRFMALYSDLADFECTQILAMTCLYVAAKVHSSRTAPLTISRIARMSKGCFERKQIVEMEKRLISILSWYMHPPVPTLFVETVRHFLYNNRNLSSAKKDQVYDMTIYLIELSVCDHFFVTKRPSSVAAAALQIGLEVAGCDLPLQVPLAPEAKEMASGCLSRMRKLYKSSFPDKEDSSRCTDCSPNDVMMTITQSSSS